MKTYLAHLKAKGVKAVPAEFSLNIALALYAQIDELRAENKFLADTAAKLAKELKQADKLADALKTAVGCFDENGHYCKTQGNVKSALLDARAALDDYKS